MYQGTAHTSGLKMRVLRGVDELHEVPGDVMQAWCRRNGMSHQRPPRLPFGLRGLQIFSRYPVDPAPPLEHPLRADRASQNLLSDLSEDRKRRAGAQARSTHAAKILTPAVGLYPLMGYRPTGGGMRVNPPSKREGPAEALYLCRCASTLRSPPAGGGLWEVSAGW